MPPCYFRRSEVDNAFKPHSWQGVVFKEFSASLGSAARPFPCVFGVAGFEADQLRFAFGERLEPAWLAQVLGAYLTQARDFGPNTSLVVFSRPGPVVSLEAYRSRFWATLLALSAQDRGECPPSISHYLTDPSWEFCFAGEPIFVVCNTPAHVFRQSRRASTFMLTFQPRWVFERLLGTPAAAERAFGKVRRRLKRYDMLPPSPCLGQYGQPGVLEHEQYFLMDDNERPSCPFETLPKGKPGLGKADEEAA